MALRTWLLLVLMGQLPSVAGHLTAPGNQLTAAQKSRLETLLTAVQSETKTDLAFYIAPSSQREPLETLAAKLHDYWKIGVGHQGGLLLVVSADGRHCALHQTRRDYPYPDRFLISLERSIEQGPLPTSLLSVANRCLRSRPQPTLLSRPWATPDRQAGGKYQAGFIGLLALALISTRRNWTRQS